MPMKVTFSTNDISTMSVYKEVSRIKKRSVSFVIRQTLREAAPSLLKKQVPFLSGAIKKTDSEFYLDIWKNHIQMSNDILDAMNFKNNIIGQRMGHLERGEIMEKLNKLMDESEIKNTIYIYIERKVSYAKRFGSGISTILSLRKTIHEGIFFDIKRAVLIPIIELIAYRIDSVLEKNCIDFSFPHICWIPIYYINDKAVMIPVIRRCDVSSLAQSEGEIIIINPFDDAIRNEIN